MEMTEDQRKKKNESQAKYAKKTNYKSHKKSIANNTVSVNVRLTKSTDFDIIAKLAEVDNKQGYIKKLIRADIAKDQTN